MKGKQGTGKSLNFSFVKVIVKENTYKRLKNTKKMDNLHPILQELGHEN